MFYQEHILNANMKPFSQEMYCFSFLNNFDCVMNYLQLLHDCVNAEKYGIRLLIHSTFMSTCLAEVSYEFDPVRLFVCPSIHFEHKNSELPH